MLKRYARVALATTDRQSHELCLTRPVGTWHRPVPLQNACFGGLERAYSRRAATPGGGHSSSQDLLARERIRRGTGAFTRVESRRRIAVSTDFVIVACGGGAPQGTGPGASLATGSPQATASRALPTGGSGLPTTTPTQTTGATSTASPAPTSTATSTETATQTPSSGASNAVAVSVGNGYACAIISEGTVACWDTAQTYGQDYGQLGNGSTELSNNTGLCRSLTPPRLRPAMTTTRTPAHSSRTALSAAGKIQPSRRTGQRKHSRRAVPLLVSGISNAVGVSAGWHDTCAVLADGTVWCWGENHSGQLGNGKSGLGTDNPDSPVPVQVIGASGATAVKTAGPQADQAYSCALLSDGTMDCWGYSGFISAGVSNPTWGAYWKIPGDRRSHRDFNSRPARLRPDKSGHHPVLGLCLRRCKQRPDAGHWTF